MSRRILFAMALLTFTVASSLAQEAKPEPKADPLVGVLEKLRKPVDFTPLERTLPIGDLISLLEKQHGLSISLGSDLLMDVDDVGAQMVKVPAGKLPIGQALRTIFGQRQYTILVRKDGIEVTTIATAAREAKTRVEENGPMPQLASPLVSAVFVEKPLNEALATIAEDFNATIMVSPQSGDAKTAFITARLLNVPLDQAIEVLALQADLRVIRKGNAYLVTSQDQSNQLFGERLDRRRQQRDAELPPVPPPAAPEGK